ncbi:MAG TPA: hypothetical protein DCO79_15870 [Spirochaeta sp.]|nr:hypothetical protein [Spirochaeta sp.]
MNNLDSLKEWISLQDSEKTSPNSELYKEFGNFFTYLFNHNQDGICLLDPSLTIICVNNTMLSWYGHKTPFHGKKCYEIYHDRKIPCDNCPTIQTLKTKTSTTLDVPYETKYAQNGNQTLTTFPVFNDSNEVIAVIEHIRDLSTDEKEKAALTKLNSMLDKQSQELMEQNIALRVLGNQLSNDSDIVINEISMKIDTLISPLVEKMKEKASGGILYPELSRLEKHISELTVPFLSRLPLEKLQLSKRELQLAEYIREGYTSKEISGMLCISKKTVDFHRANLRKKLKVKDGENLQSHLLSFHKGN